jgi:glycerophosphoryl diester phosphodiesterase
MDRLAYYVNMFGWADRTVFQDGPAAVKVMHGWYPSFSYAAIEGYATQASLNSAGTIRSGSYLRGTGAGTYTLIASAVTPTAVQYWHDSGLKVYTWTSDSSTTDTAANWTKVMGAGVDGIITNHAPDVLALETSNGC